MNGDFEMRDCGSGKDELFLSSAESWLTNASSVCVHRISLGTQRNKKGKAEKKTRFDCHYHLLISRLDASFFMISLKNENFDFRPYIRYEANHYF